MKIDELASALASVPPDSRDPTIDWDARSRLWDELAAKTEALLTSVVPGAFCTAQEWDNRLDCGVELPDGQIVGETIRVGELATVRIGQTADRFRRRCAGEPVQLINEIQPPFYIGGPPSNVS